MVVADVGNGVSAVLDWRDYLFINTDLSVHLHAPARGRVGRGGRRDLPASPTAWAWPTPCSGTSAGASGEARRRCWCGATRGLGLLAAADEATHGGHLGAVLITGCSTGIGRATAERLAARRPDRLRDGAPARVDRRPARAAAAGRWRST